MHAHAARTAARTPAGAASGAGSDEPSSASAVARSRPSRQSVMRPRCRRAVRLVASRRDGACRGGGHGSGPAGLATAYELRRRGVGAVVLERGDALGARRRSRYDGLRFQHLPRLVAPPPCTATPGRALCLTRRVRRVLLGGDRRDGRLDVRLGVEAQRVGAPDGWSVTTAQGAWAARRRGGDTPGWDTKPKLPAWALDAAFPGSPLHASQLGDRAEFRARRVLVAGAGDERRAQGRAGHDRREVDRLEPGAAVLVTGERVDTDAVILATGYRRGLEPLVGHLGVLDDRGVPRHARGAPANRARRGCTSRASRSRSAAPYSPRPATPVGSPGRRHDAPPRPPTTTGTPCWPSACRGGGVVRRAGEQRRRGRRVDRRRGRRRPRRRRRRRRRAGSRLRLPRAARGRAPGRPRRTDALADELLPWLLAQREPWS